MANNQKPEEEQKFAHPLIKEYSTLFSPFRPEKIESFENTKELLLALENDDVIKQLRMNNLFYAFFLVKARKLNSIDPKSVEADIDNIRMFSEQIKNGKEKLIFMTSILVDLFAEQITDYCLCRIFEDGRLAGTYPQTKAVLIFTERKIAEEKMRTEKEKKKNR